MAHTDRDNMLMKRAIASQLGPLTYQLGRRRRSDHADTSKPKSGDDQQGVIQGPTPAEDGSTGGPASGAIQGAIEPDQTKWELPDVTPAKARKIMDDGEVQGHPLTDKQRGAFATVAKMSLEQWTEAVEQYKRLKDSPGQTRMWKEEDHPRAADGRFGNKPGDHGPGEKPTREPTGEDATKDRDAAIRDWKENGTRAQAFKAWFGDWEGDPAGASKVVDENGEPAETYTMSAVRGQDGNPIRVYHGTSGAFDAFSKEHLGKQTAGGRGEALLFGPGFYFTEDQEIAESYSKLGERRFGGDIEGLKQMVAMALKWSKDPNSSYSEWAKDWQRAAEELEAGEIPLDDDSDEMTHFLKTFLPVASRETFWPAPEGTVLENYLNIRNPFDIASGTEQNGEALLDKLEALDWESQATDQQAKAAKLNWGKLKVRSPGEEAKHAIADLRSELEHFDGTMPHHHVYQRMTQGSINKSQMNWALQQLGYDGISHTGGKIMGDREHRVWIAFEPNQIKSTNNAGTFDPGDDRMDYARLKDSPGQTKFDWITIGGSAGPGGKHEGGTPVQIDESGKIHKGPGSLEGKTMDEVDQNKEGTDGDRRTKVGKEKPKPPAPPKAKQPRQKKPKKAPNKLTKTDTTTAGGLTFEANSKRPSKSNREAAEEAIRQKAREIRQKVEEHPNRTAANFKGPRPDQIATHYVGEIWGHNRDAQGKHKAPTNESLHKAVDRANREIQQQWDKWEQEQKAETTPKIEPLPSAKKDYAGHAKAVRSILDNLGYHSDPKATKAKPQTWKQMAKELNTSARWGNALVQTLAKTGYYTDGRYFVNVDTSAGPDSEKEKILGQIDKDVPGWKDEESVGNVAKVLRDYVKRPTRSEPATSIAYTDPHGGFHVPTVVLESEGDHSEISRTFHESILKRHPNAKPHLTGSGETDIVLYKDGRKIVGGAMPMSTDRNVDRDNIRAGTQTGGDVPGVDDQLKSAQTYWHIDMDTPRKHRGKDQFHFRGRKEEGQQLADWIGHAEKNQNGEWNLWSGTGADYKNTELLGGPYANLREAKKAIDRLGRYVQNTDDKKRPTFEVKQPEKNSQPGRPAKYDQGQIGPPSKGQPPGTRWITVNKDSEEGTAILIDADGTIVGGPAGLKGRQLRELKGTKEDGHQSPPKSTPEGRVRVEIRGKEHDLEFKQQGGMVHFRKPGTSAWVAASPELAKKLIRGEQDRRKTPPQEKPKPPQPPKPKPVAKETPPQIDRETVPGRENIAKLRWIGKQLGATAKHVQEGKNHTYWFEGENGQKIAEATTTQPKDAVQALVSNLDPKHWKPLLEAVQKRSKAPKRKQARGTQKSTKELGAKIRKIVGDDAQHRRDFMEIVNGIWKQHAEPVEAENDALRQLLGNFGMNASRIGSFLQQVRAAEDPDAIKRFDEMVQFLDDNPNIAAPLLKTSQDEGDTGTTEESLWNRLSQPHPETGKLGLARVPLRHDEAILEEATDFADRHGFFEPEAPAEQQDEDWTPFSLRRRTVNPNRDMASIRYAMKNHR